MTNATKRSILRWVHLIATIPTLGYVYGKPAEMEQYVGGVRFIFAPLIILTGYWMYAGVVFAIIGVAVWLGVYHLTGGSAGAAIVSQMVLLVARKIWLVIRARRKPSNPLPPA